MNSKSLLGAMAAAAIIFGAAAYTRADAAPSAADKAFAMKAAQGGMAEVADSKLALQKATSASVHAVAQRMVTDHSKANAELGAIARSEGIALPAMPAPADRALMAKQQKLNGAAFSSSYLKGQADAHVATIALFKQEIANGSDPRIVAFAKDTLPTIQSHLAMINGSRGGM